MSIISNLVHETLMLRGKREVKSLLKKEGFKLIGEDTTPLSKAKVEYEFSKLTEKHEEQIKKFVCTEVGEVKVPATGRINDWIAAIKLWLSDPANREKLWNIVKFIMSIIFSLMVI